MTLSFLVAALAGLNSHPVAAAGTLSLSPNHGTADVPVTVTLAYALDPKTGACTQTGVLVTFTWDTSGQKLGGVAIDGKCNAVLPPFVPQKSVAGYAKPGQWLVEALETKTLEMFKAYYVIDPPPPPPTTPPPPPTTPPPPPTNPPTQAPTQPPTQPPTHAPTQAPTDPSSSAPPPTPTVGCSHLTAALLTAGGAPGVLGLLAAALIVALVAAVRQRRITLLAALLLVTVGGTSCAALPRTTSASPSVQVVGPSPSCPAVAVVYGASGPGLD